ncbi:MAG: hypothetical protein P8X70_00710 [Nanoarchaeota archaeon]
MSKKIFGLPEKNNHQYIGTYVALSPWGGGNQNATGKFTRIENEFYILNPHQGMECDDKGNWKETIVHKDEYVPITNTRMRPITEKSFENAITSNNRKVLEYKLKQTN